MFYKNCFRLSSYLHVTVFRMLRLGLVNRLFLHYMLVELWNPHTKHKGRHWWSVGIWGLNVLKLRFRGCKSRAFKILIYVHNKFWWPCKSTQRLRTYIQARKYTHARARARTHAHTHTHTYTHTHTHTHMQTHTLWARITCISHSTKGKHCNMS